jgi:two-component system OmpR family response regulator
MRILVVEDEPKIAGAIKRGLEQETFSVDIVEDGDSAMSYAISGDYDVVVLDWMIPGSMDGQAVCKELRLQGSKIPILMLTARDSVGSKVAGLNGGADDYLAKPFSFDELIARIHALLRRPFTMSGTKLTVGKLILEPTSKSVQYGAKQLHLTAKEFSLLEYLMRQNGRVVSKNELITHVWSDDDDILPNTVEVYVGYLRNKIDRPFKFDLVKTVRGFGYKITT